LTCADELAKRGYAVTVFDSKLLPGGLLVNGIAAFKLDKSVVHRRIENLKKKGVAFRLGVTIGQDLTLTELRSRFDAVFVGVGAQKARTLDIPGIHCDGVIQALPFIVQKNTDLPMELPPIDVQGQRVAVIGGGDTAMDCLRTAIRCGAREAVCVYRRDEASMPCGHQEYDDAIEEGARFIYQAAPVAVRDDGNHRVRALRLVRTELGAADEEGRRSFTPQAGTEFEIEADKVILALGFEPVSFPPESDFSNLATNDQGTIIVDDNHMTSLPGVFAGGSIVQGPSVVVMTVRDARRAAEQMDRYLRPERESTRATRS
jgi:glutamate synthase (NADPH/NADH) small chain